MQIVENDDRTSINNSVTSRFFGVVRADFVGKALNNANSLNSFKKKKASKLNDKMTLLVFLFQA